MILTPVVPGVNFEWVRATLPPGCDAGHFPAYAPGSHEYVLVESGGLRLTIGDRVLDLDAGDLAYFAADVTHGYANVCAVACSYYVAALGFVMPTTKPCRSVLRSPPGPAVWLSASPETTPQR